MDDIFEFLGDVFGSVDFDAEDLELLLANSDFFSLDLEDLQALEALDDPEALGLFAAITVPAGHASGHADALLDSVDPDLPTKGKSTVVAKVKKALLEEAGETAIEVASEVIMESTLSTSVVRQPQIQGRFDLKPRGPLPVTQEDVAKNLFDVTDSARVSVTVCTCGAHYKFLRTTICPTCGGHDPLGFLWDVHEQAILHKLKGDLVTRCKAIPSSILAVFAEFDAGLAQTIQRSTSNLSLDESESQATQARKLMAFYDKIFDLPFLREELLGRLQVATNTEPGRIIASLQETALTYRRTLGDEAAQVAWMPTETFNGKLLSTMNQLWTEPLVQLRNTSRDLISAATAYAKVRRDFEKKAQVKDDVGTFLKWGWRIFKAVKSFGISVAFDVGRAIFKGAQEQRRFEEFHGKLQAAVAQCEVARNAIATGIGQHQRLLGTLGEKLTYHLMFSLADFYALGGPEGQEHVADCLARFGGVRRWRPGWFKERGRRAQLWRRVRLALVILSGLLVAAGAVAGLVVWLGR